MMKLPGQTTVHYVPSCPPTTRLPPPCDKVQAIVRLRAPNVSPADLRPTSYLSLFLWLTVHQVIDVLTKYIDGMQAIDAILLIVLIHTFNVA